MLSSTKNKEKKAILKRTQWYFEFKAHIGVDKDNDLVHTVKVTGANVHDVTMTSELLHGEENEVYGDSGYIGANKREDVAIRNNKGIKTKYKINRKPSQIKKLSASGKYAAKKVEHKNLRLVQRLNTFFLLQIGSSDINDLGTDV
ncbi:MAG: transposase [Ruminococcaceae bacterium]|nr:transposase [Oscillospiraceae bacterium]